MCAPVERIDAGAAAMARELALAQAVVDIATRHARGRTVAAIELRVGRERMLAGDGLAFAFSLMTAGTALDGAELEVEQVAGSDLSVDALRLHDR
ncbi:MAG TPA: hydrogenase maturation nickel metallochaperone HypA [Solirubrobacteraceae bacterium]|nr:hydrogenase maturation nickel metallochaperone HypA [Solirubrobacteraceae bacterium]